jgi:sensor histidine kinase YesM
VENAFKFGSVEDNRENYITIRLQQAGKRIEFTCSNSYEQVESSNGNNNGGGIGLINVKRRLDLLYRDKHLLTINDEEKNYHVQLTIEL